MCFCLLAQYTPLLSGGVVRQGSYRCLTPVEIVDKIAA
jgi:hypothetical protein